MKQDSYFFGIPLAVIDGLLAGDGHISRYRREGNFCSLVLGVSLSQKGFAEEVANRFREFGFCGAVKYYKAQVRLIWSTNFFWIQRKRWYPSEVKKLPQDVSNEPEMWRWLYASDGSIQQCSAYNVSIIINTQGFDYDDVLRLSTMLEQHHITAWPKKSGVSNVDGRQYYAIYIKTKDSRKFLKLTGPPVSGLEYKWEVPVIPERICGYCKSTFVPVRSDQSFCNRKCSCKASHPYYQKETKDYGSYRTKVNENERLKRSKRTGYKPRKRVA